jgi:hypothetical protein
MSDVIVPGYPRDGKAFLANLQAQRRRKAALIARESELSPAEQRELQLLTLDLAHRLPMRPGRLGREWRGEPCRIPSLDA